jgi:undecaprenyl-phosphate galactose phosphotransferase
MVSIERGGEKYSVKGDEGAEVLRFAPVFKGSDAAAGKARIARLSPLKIALFLQDLLLVSLAFGGVAWVAGLGPLLRERPIEWVPLLVFSLLTMAFFQANHLYSYRHIFLAKRHLILVLKACSWSMLPIALVLAIYEHPGIFTGNLLVPLMWLAAIPVLLLSHYYWSYLLDILKSFGLSFCAFGLIDVFVPKTRPIVLELWYVVPLGFLLTVAFLVLSRFFLVHQVFANWLKRLYRRQLVIVGRDEEARKVANHIVDLNAPYWVAGFVCSPDAKDMHTSVPKRRLGEFENLPQIVKNEKVSEVVVTDESMDKTALISLLDYCTSHGLTVWFPPKLMPIIEMKLIIDSFCGLPMVRLCSQKSSSVFNKVKHSLDALLTLPGIIVLLPLFLIIGVAVKLNSPGPVFYRAKAMGKKGKPFAVYKFRSMRVDTDCGIHKDYVTRLIKGEICPEREGNRPLKVTNDPRITSVGRLLRKSSLDELPQLFNVLKGDMSLVGPRPCLPYEFEIYKDWHKKRLSVRPGITGLWQVAGRSAVAFEDMVLLDLYYVYNRSLSMDMNILYETIFAVMARKGAY